MSAAKVCSAPASGCLISTGIGRSADLSSAEAKFAGPVFAGPEFAGPEFANHNSPYKLIEGQAGAGRNSGLPACVY